MNYKLMTYDWIKFKDKSIGIGFDINNKYIFFALHNAKRPY